ncbi:IS66 family insertion sequence element accessory protein TnpB, partial [Mesorhizobium shangrilense]
GYRASQRRHRAARNTDERGESPSQTATGTMNRLHFQVSYKRLEDGKFCWPAITDGVVRLSAAQLQALLEGLDWRRVHDARETRAPVAAS